MRVRLKYVRKVRDRYGTTRWYYRRGGREYPIKAESGTAEFIALYQALHASFEVKAKTLKAIPETYGDLVGNYLASTNFTHNLAKSSQIEMRRNLEKSRNELGKYKLTDLSRRLFKAYHDSMAKTPRSANNALGYIKQLLNYAVKEEFIPVNPAANIEKLRDDGTGWEPWPEEAMDEFEAKSLGTPRRGYFLARYTGQRRADCLNMGEQDIKDGCIRVVQEKTGAELWIPIAAPLMVEIEKWRAETLRQAQDRLSKGKPVVYPKTFVHKRNGEAYTDDGFGAIWNREQHRLKLHHAFHGLRKNATITLVEIGCTEKQAMAITGHSTAAMFKLYSKGADQKKLAQQAVARMDRAFAARKSTKPDQSA